MDLSENFGENLTRDPVSHSLPRNLPVPIPPIQCCYIPLLGRALKKHSHFGSDAGMHWSTTLIKGARGDQV
jgi:hypothetical protein